MPTQLASLDSLVHPHQIEVQEFSSYALVIDARSAEAYQEDHIPGAVSMPVDALRLQVPKAEGTALVARDAEPSVPYALAAHLGGLGAGASLLVYCDRGGLDSLVWAEPLKALGYRVDVLGGGWGNFRRWVDAGLEVLPRALTFRRLAAPPLGGLCLVLERLLALGEQVLDLAELAGQRLIPGLTFDADDPPSQAAFDSALLNALRRMDPRMPVWVRGGFSDLGRLELAPALKSALMSSKCLWLDVSLAARVHAWHERLLTSGIDLNSLLQKMTSSGAPPTKAAVDQWRSLANSGLVIDALADIIKNYIDHRFQAPKWAGQATIVALETLAVDVLTEEVDRWRTSLA